MFDVLVYLYESCGPFSDCADACADGDAISRRLVAAGFPAEEISDALAWLQGLQRTSQSATVAPSSSTAFRVYAGFESERLGADAVSFLAFLEAAGQLSAAQREIVIERALALDVTPVPLEQFKVIVLIVLWSQQADIDVLLLEELLDDGEERALH